MLGSRALCVVGGAWLLQRVSSQSVKSCGSATDHLTHPVYKMTPDPPVKGQPFTIEISGDLDEDITAGALSGDIAVTALGFIKSTATIKTPFTYTPGLPKGATKVTVGPTTLPSSPGSFALKGKVHVVDGKGDAITCIDMDITSASDETLLTEAKAEILSATVPHVRSVESCTADSDHLKNFTLSQSGGVTTVTGNLDEDVNTFNADLDLTVKKLFFHIPIKMNVPITLSPTVPKGPFKIAAGPAEVELSPDPNVGVAGRVSAKDAASEQIFCLNIDEVVESSSHESIVV